MRAFITGSSGFVGKWLGEHLLSCGDETTSLDDSIDIRDQDKLREALADQAPEVIFHLAALTHVGRSFEDPITYLEVNALGTYKLLEAARTLTKPPRVLLISSAEVYGVTGQNKNGEPLEEKDPLLPATPYAMSKVAAEYAGLQEMHAHGLEVVIARPFNHIGPGQGEAFVVSALAKRIAMAEAAGTDVIPIGNLSAKRDFTDVRDVVAAYRLLALGGKPGQCYNVCSGVPTAIAEIAERLIGLSGHKIELRTDENLLRPVDLPILYGSSVKLREELGWEPSVPGDRTLADVLQYWRQQIGQSA